MFRLGLHMFSYVIEEIVVHICGSLSIALACEVRSGSVSVKWSVHMEGRARLVTTEVVIAS